MNSFVQPDMFISGASFEAAKTDIALPNRAGWPFGNLQPFSYDLLFVDPPWPFELYSDKGAQKSASQHYATMSLGDIKRLPVGHLAAGNASMILWGTSPLLLDRNAPSRSPIGEVIEAWGFRYGAFGGWAKRTKKQKLRMGLGYVVRSVMEPFFICVSGTPKHSNSSNNLINGLAREHSRKPDAAYRWCEKYMPNARRVELFSRMRRPGWDSWGLEAEKFNSREMGDSNG